MVVAVVCVIFLLLRDGNIVQAATTLSCPNDCSGTGLCNAATTRCDCFVGFTGHDCSSRSCPLGLQWIGYASATDTLHTTMTECSSAGDCDRTAGTCKCTAPYSGNACQYIGCPPYGSIACKGNGKCMSLKDVGPYKDDIAFHNTATYSLWDAERIFGCVCDYGFTGHDCALRTCPFGDDPTALQTSTVDIQAYTCSGTGGAFVIEIFGFVTTSIAYNANQATVKAALEALPPIKGVTVSYSSGSVMCSGSTVTSSITFTHLSGDVPQFTFPTQVTGGTIAYSALTRDGTSTREECSGRGKCSRTGETAGLCTCETVKGTYASSSGTSENAAGGAGDCSYTTATGSTCTFGSSTTVVCSGHGKFFDMTK
jgi:hypothetical protein